MWEFIFRRLDGGDRGIEIGEYMDRGSLTGSGLMG